MIGSMIGREAVGIATAVYEQPYARLEMAGTQAMHVALDDIGTLITQEDRDTRPYQYEHSLQPIFIQDVNATNDVERQPGEPVSKNGA